MPGQNHPKIAQVLVPIPVDAPFSYEIPEEFADLICPGIQVIVPMGDRYVGGIVMAVQHEKPAGDFELKPLHDVVDPEPYIGEDLLRLLSWIADYYICHLGEAVKLIQPALNLEKSCFQVQRQTTVVPEDLTPLQRDFMQALPPGEWVSLAKVENLLARPGLLHCAHKLKRHGCLNTRYTPPRSRKIYKTIDCFSLLPKERWPEAAQQKYAGASTKRATRALKLIRFLQEHPAVERPQLQAAGFSTALVRKLHQEGLLEKTEKEVFRVQQQHFSEAEKHIVLNDEQREFVDKIVPLTGENARFCPFLLHGITGSGKTQIYIELIKKVLAAGREAIVLIPEIVLTPQTMARFHQYFGDKVAVLHSRISTGERTEILDKIRRGEFQIVIGPRSAVFVPFKRLGIIIVDEEHESSYKQGDAVPRYNARDVALYRAYLLGIPVVLGSATPSIESLYNAKTGKYEYYHLSRRIQKRNLPRTQLVDNKEQWRKGGELPLFSDNLLLKMETRLVLKEQAMILQNRRGFSPYLLCQECGYIEKCPNCDITLTYHAKGHSLRCHYCGHFEPAPDLCPRCRGLDILYKGIGTQKIEAETRERFPYARLLRMDQDTTRRKHDHAKLLEKFRNHEADFLIGTKMIAKGLDFEKVTLVGVVNADQGLNFPDFRAAEKTFQMLVQAAGRAGRGLHSGEVVIQTFDPNHFIFKYLQTHDYLGFYEKELTIRKTLNYPPFSRLCLIRVVGDSEERVLQYARDIARYLWRCNTDKKYSVLGPAPAPLAKIANKYRYHVLIKQVRSVDPSMSYVRRVIKEGLLKNPDLKKWPVTVQIDVDPLDIL